MAGIILNGSVIKGLILNGSPVSAMLNGVKVFPTVEPGPTPVGDHTYRFNGNSNIPMTYTINGTSFTVNDGTLHDVTLHTGDTLNITATSQTGKTFSLKGLEFFTVTSCVWNHKSNGSTVNLTATFTGTGTDNKEIGFDLYRDKEYTAYGSWRPATDTGAYDYQPGSYIDTITTNLLKSGDWCGTDYLTDITDFTDVAMNENSNGGGYGSHGWGDYRIDATPRYQCSKVFAVSKIVSCHAAYHIVHLSGGGTGSTVYVQMWGASSSGGSSTMGSFSMTRLGTIDVEYDSSSYRTPVLCVEIGGTASSNAPMSHEGTVILTGIMK